MTFADAVKEILASAAKPQTPQEIRAKIKGKYSQFYGTASHRRSVAKGHCKDLDHALLAQIYSLVRMSKSFSCNMKQKPMIVSLRNKYSPSAPIMRLKETIIRNDDDLIANLEYYYQRSLKIMEEFGGPSIYFHVQSIKEQERAFLSERHIEMIYATLVSWGMHKMGNPHEAKAKMVNFLDFKESIFRNRYELQELRCLRMDSCSQEHYQESIDRLRRIYLDLRVSISEATIVAHSKTLAHILPNLVPPIDRQYTVRFFTQDKKNFFSNSGKYKMITLPHGIDAQFRDFKNYCLGIKMLFDRCNHQLFTINKETFNTSYPKIMDNLIVAFVKDVAKREKAASKIN
jgi:hypothetical protein